MQIGVFIPIGNNGWIISKNSPQYLPSFELNKKIVLKAEEYGLDFALSMIKLHGFGGETKFWDYNLDSLTLMAGLAAVTEKIKIYATVPTLVIPPAIAARMAVTLDSISNGRFGLNLVTGWQKAEYDQMGLWPGSQHYKNRYNMLSEYTQILLDLWGTGISNFKGDYFTMNNCKLLPKPSKPIELICAGSSDKGINFSAQYADHLFCLGVGINTPKAFSVTNQRLLKACEKTHRKVDVYVLMMIIADKTDKAAEARWQYYLDGIDTEAVEWLVAQGESDKKNATSNVSQLSDAASAINLNFGTLIGSYEKVAQMLDEISEVDNTAGVMLVFDDFEKGIKDFGKYIQPIMQARNISQ
jgi:pyrimidine oxygenase